jgi:hypothetical protein
LADTYIHKYKNTRLVGGELFLETKFCTSADGGGGRGAAVSWAHKRTVITDELGRVKARSERIWVEKREEAKS